jgi:hypothetical protein
MNKIILLLLFVIIHNSLIAANPFQTIINCLDTCKAVNGFMLKSEDSTDKYYVYDSLRTMYWTGKYQYINMKYKIDEINSIGIDKLYLEETIANFKKDVNYSSSEYIIDINKKYDLNKSNILIVFSPIENVEKGLIINLLLYPIINNESIKVNFFMPTHFCEMLFLLTKDGNKVLEMYYRFGIP